VIRLDNRTVYERWKAGEKLHFLAKEFGVSFFAVRNAVVSHSRYLTYRKQCQRPDGLLPVPAWITAQLVRVLEQLRKS